MYAERMARGALRVPSDRWPARVRTVPRHTALKDSAQERARKRLVALVLFIYLLAIFEGSIRKYLLPQFGQYIFFVRDPFLLYVYLLATRFRLWPRNSLLFRLSLLMCPLGLLLLGVQAATGPASDLRLLLGVYGWRSYFLYAPLAFLVGAQFRRDDLARFAKLTLVLTVPIAMLVALQFFSPVSAPINVGVADEAELQFKGATVDVEHVRATGPFSSNVGQQQFVATAWAFLLAWLLLPAAQRKIPFVLLLVAAAAILTCVGLGGSRGTLLQCALIALFTLATGVLGRGAAFKAKALVLPALLATVAAVLYPIVFPAGFAVFVERWNAASSAEAGFEGGVLGRALYGLIDFVRLIELVPPFGYGLGYGGNASTTLHATIDGVMPGSLAESDFARHMVDLGFVFGLAYMAFRLSLVISMTRQVLRATRRAADPLPMMLFSYAGYVVLQGQLTGNGSINIYGWLFAGLCMAASREAVQPSAPLSPHSTVVSPRGRIGSLRELAPRSLRPYSKTG
jgi:hypothetical protein